MLKKLPLGIQEFSEVVETECVYVDKRFFANYWFSTGTPTMLMDIIEEQKLTAFDIEKSYTSTEILDKYDFENKRIDDYVVN